MVAVNGRSMVSICSPVVVLVNKGTGRTRQDLLFLVLLVGAISQLLQGVGDVTSLTRGEGTGTVIGVDFRIDQPLVGDAAGEVFTGATLLDNELLREITI